MTNKFNMWDELEGVFDHAFVKKIAYMASFGRPADEIGNIVIEKIERFLSENLAESLEAVADEKQIVDRDREMFTRTILHASNRFPNR